MGQTLSPSFALAHKVAHLFADLSQVEAVALGGSQAGDVADAMSDIDLYIYTRADIPLAERQRIVERAGGASSANLGMIYWGASDEWFDADTGIEVDIIYFDVPWIEAQINRVLRDHEASLGYTTCFWHIIRHSQPFHDPNGWFQELQRQSQQDYPEALCRNIIALNHPVLRNVIPAYTTQLEKAVKRHDLVSVNHRLAAMLASYFDVIFAVNRTLHPGEKRFIAKAGALCEKLPVEMADDIEAVIQASVKADANFMIHVTRLLDHLDQLLVQEGFDPHLSRPDMLT